MAASDRQRFHTVFECLELVPVVWDVYRNCLPEPAGMVRMLDVYEFVDVFRCEQLPQSVRCVRTLMPRTSNPSSVAVRPSQGTRCCCAWILNHCPSTFRTASGWSIAPETKSVRSRRWTNLTRPGFPCWYVTVHSSPMADSAIRSGR